MRSILADYCPKGRKVNSVASCEFYDEDGIPVITALLLTKDKCFGELYFWKVTDEPILKFPHGNSFFKQF